MENTMNFFGIIDRFSHMVLDLVFPRRCIGCGKEGRFLCSECRESLPCIETPYCKLCGIPVHSGNKCSKCDSSPMAIDSIRSLFLHEGLARDAVHSMKYNNLKALAPSLAPLMNKYLQTNPLPVDVLLAVPMHSKRIRRRGYNQAHLLAKELGLLTQLPVSEGSLVRLRNTPSQVSLGADARHKNMKEAFRCNDEAFRDKRVLLIDDVCTTGATLQACALALKQANAARVWGLTLSRDC